MVCVAMRHCVKNHQEHNTGPVILKTEVTVRDVLKQLHQTIQQHEIRCCMNINGCIRSYMVDE